MSAVHVHFPQCVGSMSADSWIHWHPFSLLFNCFLGVPPLAESFCSDNVLLLLLSHRSGTDPLKQPQSPRHSLRCLEGEDQKRTERTKRFKPINDYVVAGYQLIITWWVWTVRTVKYNEWPGVSMLTMLNRVTFITTITLIQPLFFVQAWVIAAMTNLQASNAKIERCLF